MLTKCLGHENLELFFRVAPKGICESLDLIRLHHYHSRPTLASVSPGIGTQQTTSVVSTESALSCHIRNIFNLACPAD